MSRSSVPRDLAALQAEMRQILLVGRPSNSAALKRLRADNQARFDAALRSRPRPTRVS